MSFGKGGARHTPKPQVDADLLLQCFSENSELLQNLGIYEQVSQSQAAQPKGLVHCLPLLKGLLALGPTCEIHGSSLRQGVFQALLQNPSLNDSKYNGETWVGIQVERITVLLFHMRRLAASADLRACASKLTGPDFLKLQDTLALIERKGQQQMELPLVEREAEEESTERRQLKKNISEVSVDSNGFPKALATPAKEPSEAEAPLVKGEEPGETVRGLPGPSFKRRRPGSLAWQEVAPGGNASLRDALGIGKGSAKKPAAKKVKKKEKTATSSKDKTPLVKGKSSSKKGEPSSSKKKPLIKGKVPASYPRKAWTKLLVTTTSKAPWRTYITGTTEPNGKKHLIVETTKHKHPKYKEILQKIKERLEEDNITKEEALELRQELYANFP